MMTSDDKELRLSDQTHIAKKHNRIGGDPLECHEDRCLEKKSWGRSGTQIANKEHGGKNIYIFIYCIMHIYICAYTLIYVCIVEMI